MSEPAAYRIKSLTFQRIKREKGKIKEKNGEITLS
jgi:hypothetical protein